MKQAYGFVQYHTAAEGRAALTALAGAEIKGRLPIDFEVGVVLPKGSENTETVSKIVEAMKADGSVEKIYDQWMWPDGENPTESIPLWNVG